MTLQVDSVTNTNKNGDIKLYRAVEELKPLFKSDGRNNVGRQYTEQTEHVNKQDG